MKYRFPPEASPEVLRAMEHYYLCTAVREAREAPHGRLNEAWALAFALFVSWVSV